MLWLHRFIQLLSQVLIEIGQFIQNNLKDSLQRHAACIAFWNWPYKLI